MRVLAVLLIAVAAVAAVLIHGREETWQLVFGPADLGAVDFQALERSGWPNDALACRRRVCPKSTPDVVPPIYAVPADELDAVLHAAVTLEPLIDRVDTSSAKHAGRYVQRSRLLRFPDTISVRTIALGPKRSTVALYSRSKIGYSDMGANKARLERWIKLLDELPKAK
ncbi:MAG: DUF1499 domain-containing protein [Methyloligellaceae bacterium]